SSCRLPAPTALGYTPSVRRPAVSGRAIAWFAAVLAFAASSIGVGQNPPPYVETVTFEVVISETTYRGAVSEIHLMLDRFGGRNRLQDSRRMMNAGGDRWRISVPLQEGDY